MNSCITHFFSVLVCDLKRGSLRVAKRRFRHAKGPFYDPKSASFKNKQQV